MNIMKKDIVVKNSIRPRTYMDYDTARLFYETNRISDLPEELQEIIMDEVKKSWMKKNIDNIKVAKRNIQHLPLDMRLYCCAIIKSGKKKGCECRSSVNNYESYYPYKYKHDYDCSKDMTPPDVVELITRTQPLKAYQSDYHIYENRNENFYHICLRTCGRHAKNIYDFKQAVQYLNMIGYDLRNGYLIKK